MALTLNPPPTTPTEPVTNILHGVAITDPYRWLEDQKSPRTRHWLEEQSAYTRTYLDAITGRDRIRKRVEELLAVEMISEPWKVGNRYFFLKRGAHQEQPVIMMREGDSDNDISLVDPAARGEGTSTAVRIAGISFDGRVLAYTVRTSGQDCYSVEFLDVDRKETLRDRLPNGFCGGLSFTPDGDGFYYVHRPPSADLRQDHAVRWHAFGTSHDQDRQNFAVGGDSNLNLMMFGSQDGAVLAYIVVRLAASRTMDLYLHDVASGSLPWKIVEKMQGIFAPKFAGKVLVALTDWKAPNYRIVAIDPEFPQHNGWREVVPESHRRIQSFAVAGGLLFVGYVDKGASRVEILGLDGRKHGELPCPDMGTCRILPCRPESDTLFYSFTSFSDPLSIFSYNTHTRQHQVWAKSRVAFEPSSIEIEQVQYRSKDGTTVPMFLVAKKGWRGLRHLPAFLTGYGGFGASVTPQFAAYATFLVERGCLFAVTNVRGGSEFGRQWHDAGKRHNRQNAIDDFIAAAEWLTDRSYTNPNRLAIGGGSNAGLLVAAAATQRPELFRAVICLGPLLDMLRYHQFDSANGWVEEYGSAENAEDFPFLRAYSPYHLIEDGAAYPAILLISGDADTRCNPMHARKMTARLQAANSSEHPILLDYKQRWGHTPVQPLSTRIEALTDRLAFLCHELGVCF
jgi:prolyl oligopeptidase